MNVEIRKSFQKNALKLPAPVQVQLAKVIDNLSDVEKLSDLSSCKKLAGFKNAYRIRMGAYRMGSFLRMKLLNWCAYWGGKRFINTSHSKGRIVKRHFVVSGSIK